MKVTLEQKDLKGCLAIDLPKIGDVWELRKKRWKIDRIRRLMNGGIQLIFVEIA